MVRMTVSSVSFKRALRESENGRSLDASIDVSKDIETLLERHGPFLRELAKI